MATIARVYLFAYNSAMCAGWTAVLLRLAYALCSSTQVYEAVKLPLQIFQTGAILEVLHSLFGLVRASVATTAIQVASRVGILWGVCHVVPEVQEVLFLTTMILAWSLTEIPRYLYFAVAVIADSVPYWLTWLRYSTFFPLYPLGASSEWLVLYSALGPIRETKLFAVEMPNRYNFAFDYYVLAMIVLALYLPGLPHMYKHMIQQRRKYLGRLSTAKVKPS